MADLSKTGKPSSRSREMAYRALVLAGRKAKPSVAHALLAELGLKDPTSVRVAALREQRRKR